MENINLLMIFIGVTALAVLIQAGMLTGMYLALRKNSSQVEALTAEVKSKALPVVAEVHSMLSELRPRIETVVGNVSESSTLVRAQIQRIDATVNDILDRTRLQVIRADELLTRTLEQVEDTTDTVHRAVVSPVRQLSGLVAGVTAGLDFLMGARRRRDGAPASHDEMFI
jgi:methyl-accepting chemotaxis protein